MPAADMTEPEVESGALKSHRVVSESMIPSRDLNTSLMHLDSPC